MELKNAVTTCLIALFSATLVLLIARALDIQAASRLEPQLKLIAEELKAIRESSGFAAASGEGIARRATDDALMVYYFHGERCPTCRAAEANAHETLTSAYASQLKDGEVVWKVLDYTTDEIAVKFGVASPTIVLAKMKDGEIDVSNLDTWNRLDQLLSLANDKAALGQYLQSEIQAMLKSTPPDTPAVPEVPTPTDIPLPGLPIPEPAQTDADAPPLP